MARFYILLFLISFALISCEKELDFEYHEIEPKLVIEGTLSDEAITVKITETTPMNEKLEENYLTDAEVFLIDEENGERLPVYADKNGIFVANYSPEPGNEYVLEILREGKKYLSHSIMRPATTILGLKFQWIKMPYDYVAVLQILFRALENDDCYWIRIYRNGAPYKWLTADNSASVNGVINEVVMTSRKDLDKEDDKDILRDGDEVAVTVNVISREMFDYLTAIEGNSNGPQMFSGDFCLGYFMASASVSDSIIFRPDEMTQYE